MCVLKEALRHPRHPLLHEGAQLHAAVCARADLQRNAQITHSWTPLM